MLGGVRLLSQDAPPAKPEIIQGEPHYDDTFSGPIVELSDDDLIDLAAGAAGEIERRAMQIELSPAVRRSVEQRIIDNDADCVRRHQMTRLRNGHAQIGGDVGQ